ncbi:MAG: Mur ligase family protein [bacterium]
MLTVSRKKQKMENESFGIQRSYNEVVAYLDSKKSYEYSEKSLERMKQLDELLQNPSEKIDTILIGGTNGKSSALHFTAKLLKEEGFKVGVSYSNHFLNYNERIILNSEIISNKDFTDAVNKIIDVVEQNEIGATVFEILTMSSLIYFNDQNADVILLEVGMGGKYDATNICNPKICAVTRIACDHLNTLGSDLDAVAFEMLEIAKEGSWFISAEQSKLRLQKMKDFLSERGVRWAMPIRKLATLPYLYEQLYGRSASLGERIAQIYVEDIKGRFSPFLRGNLLATQKGQRGRPTLKAKQDAQINPLKTLKNFWRDQFDLLKGRFEILKKEQPVVLIDTAHNVDAFENLFLGIRLLHYQKPLKGLAIIMGISKNINSLEAIKAVRYLLRKISGQIYFIPLPNNQPSHDTQTLVDLVKEMGIRAKSMESFSQAFELAKEFVDEHDGLIAIFGSNDIVSQYWKNREIKKI